MKKTLHIITFAAVAIAALSSCAKEELKENAIPAGEKIEVSLNGLIGDFIPADATKATAESVVRVTWGSGDKVYVYDGGNASIGTLTVTPDNNNASYAMLSGTITASSASPSKLTLVYVKGANEAPTISGGKISVDLSTQNQAEVPFVLYTTVAYDAAALTKTNEYISFSFATSVMTVNCTGLQTRASGAIAGIDRAEIDGVSTACELTVDGSGVTAVAGTTLGKITRTEITGTGASVFQQSDSRGSFRLALAADPAAPAARNILVHQGSKVSGSPFTSATLAAGKSYNTVYQMTEYVSIMLPGGFSVNANGKKVHFSKGNLVAEINAIGNPTDWKFSANQYDYLGEGGANKTIGSAAGDVDLFGWSTSNNGGTSTTDNYGIKTSKTGSDYSGYFYDWGKAYCDKNSITPDNTWRTLTSSEWDYLTNIFGGENQRKNRCKYGVTVCGKTNCMVLAPDDWDISSNALQSEYSTTSTPMTWEQAEAAGLVCLPAAGNRDGSAVGQSGNKGFYWSSTDGGTSVWYVAFGNDYVNSTYNYNRYPGYSVRLVTESSGGYAPAVKVTGVSLKSKTTIEVGAKETLAATVAPANATNRQINWLSSNTSVATVDAASGEVTGVAPGPAVITATTADGNFTAVCIVTVVRLSLPGEFTINSDGDKIHFAKGNLYCSRTSSSSNDWTWHFYDEQYQYNSIPLNSGSDSDRTATAADSEIDLFTWGYNAEKSTNPIGNNKDNVTRDSGNLTLSEDWGFVFGGNSSHWRTLTKDEWEYIISTRTSADKLGYATIGTVKGIVILPDSFALPAGCAAFVPKSSSTQSDANTYTQGNSGSWKAMENAGAVFLPAAGRRGTDGTNVNNVGDLCCYWSSSAISSSQAYSVFIKGGDYNQSDRNYGFSVRLVK